MASNISPENEKSATHTWTFFRAGGFDQVYLESGADLMALDQLDQKLWVALSCPTRGLEFDVKTLYLLDSDGDGRIRAPEVIEAVKWAGSLLKNPDELTKRSSALPLSSINDQTVEGKEILSAAKKILENLGKSEAYEITLEDTADTARILSQTNFNGDGIIPADAADDPALQQIIKDIIDCLGADTDRSGKPGISQEKVEQFFSDSKSYLDWSHEPRTDASKMPLGEATVLAADAFLAIREKIDDYFTRCRLAAFDARAVVALNRQETEYIAIAEKQLSPSLEAVVDFPLAQIEARKALPLTEGINPAWTVKMRAFYSLVVKSLLGEKEAISEQEWNKIIAFFAPYIDWLSRKTGVAVEKLGEERLREIIGTSAKEKITALIERDKALAPEFSKLESVDKLVRYYRDIFTFLNNYVAFSDFYTGRNKAIFQAGTLYMDGRSCDLCVRVDDMGQHASIAALSRVYLAYCDCTRRGGSEKMTIAAAFTGGDSDFLMVGRNGIFYDRKGNDWDAHIVRIVEHPISIRQAFWSPYKRIAKMIGEQIQKIAAARDKAAADKAAASITDIGQKVDAGKAPSPPAFDVGKFAGIFAAIGLALGAIGTAIAAILTGLFRLPWWQMPIVFVVLVLAISGPSMILAWLKLRQRNLAPILDANGWAINARVRININFSTSLTKLAALPQGAVRRLDDPFADKKSPWPKILLAFLITLLLLYIIFRIGIMLK